MNFLIVFHMIWKNQESWQLWLPGFWVSRHSKRQKISANVFFFFFAFLGCQYGFTNYFDILIFFFLISYQEKFQAVKYPSKISTSRNIKLKNCRIQFIGLFGWFFLNFAPKTFCTLKMFLLKGPHNFILYWIHM